MSVADVVYMPEEPAHDPEIEAINEEAFGPGRFARAAYKIREGGPHDLALSFVALCHDKVIASVRMTPIAGGEGRALLLGPLAVRPQHKGIGIGKELVRIALEAAEKAGWGVVILVGD
jgi:predicted N-acetyltransferase YhbS